VSRRAIAPVNQGNPATEGGVTESLATENSLSRQRRAGMTAIALSGSVATVLWFAIDRLMPPVAAMDALGDRMLFTLKWCCVAVLFCLVTGVEAVAHERLTSPAFDPLSGFETPRLRVNQRYLQNTLEQMVVFAAGLFGLAAYCADGSAMRAVVATSVVWILARFAFWIGYHRSAAMRGLGAPGMALSMFVLLYVVGRFGYDIGGVVGAAAPVALFLAIEAVLFWTTRPLLCANG
jgi:MAPEG family